MKKLYMEKGAVDIVRNVYDSFAKLPELPPKRVVQIGKICFVSEIRPYLSPDLEDGPWRICLPFCASDAETNKVFKEVERC